MLSPTAFRRLHELSVFISSGLLLAGFGLEVKPFFDSARPKHAGLAARWCLWLGTAGLLVSVGTGFLQPPKSIFFQETSFAISEHRFLGVWTAIVFVVLSLWRYFAGRRAIPLLVLVWMAAFWILGTQALGGHRLAGILSY